MENDFTHTQLSSKWTNVSARYILGPKRDTCATSSHYDDKLGSTWDHYPPDRYTSHVIFLMQLAQFISCISHCMAQVSVCARVIPSSCHPWWAFDCLLVASSFCLSPCFSPLFTSSLPHSTCTLPSTSSPMSTASRELTTAPSPNEEYCTMAIYHPLTGYEPNVLDDFHYSETSALIFQDESGDIDTEPSYLCDADLDDEIIGKALSSPLFIQERRTSADRRQSLSLSWKKFVASSVVVCRSCKNGETRIRAKFRFVSKTEVKSRPGKRANQDSPWKTKRVNRRWSQNWDPWARISSRFC